MSSAPPAGPRSVTITGHLKRPPEHDGRRARSLGVARAPAGV